MTTQEWGYRSQGLQGIALFTDAVQSRLITHTWKVPVQFLGKTAAKEDVGFNTPPRKAKTHCRLLCSAGGKLKKWKTVIRAPTEMHGKAPGDIRDAWLKKKPKPCSFCFVFSFLYNSKIALGSRRNMTQRQTFPLKAQLPSLNSSEKFQLHVSLSKGFIWSSPIVWKTPPKRLWPLQQTSWVRQVRHRVQDFVLLGCYFIQESRMWDLPWPFALKQETLQDDILAQAVSLDTKPSRGSVFWHNLCHLGCQTGQPEPCWVRQSQAPPEMREGSSTTVQTSPAGGEHPPGVFKQLQTDPLNEKNPKQDF